MSETRTMRPSDDPRIRALVASILEGSAFAQPRTWPSAVVILRGDEKRVCSRGDLAHVTATAFLVVDARLR